MNQYYVVVVIDDIEPTVHGPWATTEARDQFARVQRQEDEALNNGVFALDIEDGKVEMWAFGSSYLTPSLLDNQED